MSLAEPITVGDLEVRKTISLLIYSGKCSWTDASLPEF